MLLLIYINSTNRSLVGKKTINEIMSNETIHVFCFRSRCPHGCYQECCMYLWWSM